MNSTIYILNKKGVTMTITIYGIKSCSTMKKAFTKLDELGVSYEFHDYKKQETRSMSVESFK